MRALWLLIPDEALILIVVAVGLALILRLISGRTAAAVLGGLALSLLLAPVVEVLFAELPPWVGIMILAALGMVIIRAVLSLLLGERAAGHAIGILAADAIRLVVLFPFRLLAWIFRR